MSIMTKPSKSIFEGISLLVGVVGILASVIYYLNAYGFLKINIDFAQETVLSFFLAMTLISGIVLVISTIGMLSMK